MTKETERPEWYRAWFGEEYLALYPHRDQEEAREGVELVLAALGVPDGRVLDLASGAGRHLVEFVGRGLDATGLDLSLPLLRRAREIGVDLQLVRGDMRRLPFADRSFSLVTNFFTSFGYFARPVDDRRVVSELRRVLHARGGFALDFLNSNRVRANLVPRDERELDGINVVQERRLVDEGRVVVKRIQLMADGETTGEFEERVRLYSERELRELLEAEGLEIRHTFGDYGGADFDRSSARLILMGSAV